MATDIFTWAPNVGVTGTNKFRVLTAQFGDGFKQTAADGINNSVQSWPLMFTKNAAGIQPIKNFLDAHPSGVSFYWTPPLGVPGYYQCLQYTLKALDGGIYTIAATFEQIFKP